MKSFESTIFSPGRFLLTGSVYLTDIEQLNFSICFFDHLATLFFFKETCPFHQIFQWIQMELFIMSFS